MSSKVVLTGLGIAFIAFTSRFLVRRIPFILKPRSDNVTNRARCGDSSSNYFKGGFDTKMNLREASLILGVSPTSSKIKIKDAFRKLMAANHPDRGGSPYIATKINEARDYLEKRNLT